MSMIGEKRNFEKIGISFVGGSENYPSHMVAETSTEDSLTEKDTEKLSSVKRALSLDEEQPSSIVHVTYRSLPRKSRKKLEELLLGWSEWHSQHCKNYSDEELESGEESYYPALHLGCDASSTLSFLSDVPLIKKHCKGLSGIDKELVPLYDRGYVVPLCSNNSESVSKRCLNALEDTRCFNCGSYDHSLKDCSRPRDNDAIANARNQRQAKKKGSGRQQVPTRYFQNSPAGKYDGLKQGFLSAETRQLLGIGEQDPPPWHHRIQELGYPPGHTVVESDEEPASGITLITGDEAIKVGKNDDSGSKFPKTMKIKSAGISDTIIPTSKRLVPKNCSSLHPRGVDIPLKKPNNFPHSELHYTRQMPDPSWGDRDLRISRSFGVTSPLDSFGAERDFRYARRFGSFGDNPPDNLFMDDRDYMDARFSGSFRGSPKHDSFLAEERDYRDDGRSSRSFRVDPPSPKYFSGSYSGHITDSPFRGTLQGHYGGRSPDRWSSFYSVEERFSFDSPCDHLPFALSPPDDSPFLPTQQTYGRNYLHNGY